MSEIIREKLTEGVVFTTIPVSKFKTARLTLNAYVPLKRETAYLNNIAGKIVVRSSEKYPDFTILSKYLSSLYGATIAASTSKFGDMQVIGLTVAGIDDRYTLDNEIISKDYSELLCELIFNPKIKDGAFDSDETEQAKREVIESIDADFNEKRIYATQKAVEYMCKSEPCGLPSRGTKEQVESATPKQAYDAWKELIKNAHIEIIFSGGSDPVYAKESFRSFFSKYDRHDGEFVNTVVRRAEKVSTYSEEMELSQSKMILGYRTDCARPEKDMYNTVLMCAVLGGTAHSKLFNNVREKQSLCYYCSSRYDSRKGIMLIESGVEKENIEKTKNAILKEIEDMKNGVISDFEIDSAKLSITNAYRESKDLSSSTETWYSGQFFDDEILTVEQACERLLKVTKEDIVEAANRLTLDTEYTLVGSGVQ